MQKELKTVRLQENIYRIWEDSDYMNVDAYLICGKERTVMIDGLCMAEGLLACVRKLTALPVSMLITHGHFDHAGCGMTEFLKAGLPVFMSHKDMELLQRTEQKADLSQIKDIKDGDVFELGERTVRCMELPGHTKGSLMFYLEEDNLLFSGDSIGSGGFWMQLKNSSPLSKLLPELKKTEAFVAENPGMKIYPGHSWQITPYMENEDYLDKAYVEELLFMTKGLLDGSLAGEPKKIEMEGMEDIDICSLAGKHVTDYCYDREHIYSKIVKVKRLNDHIWLLNEQDESTGYLVVGEKKALLIDSMIGYEDLKELVADFTDLPVEVVNTHGHPDHIYGNVYFERAYIHQADLALAEGYLSEGIYGEEMQKRPSVFEGFVPVNEGHVFDLGGVRLEVFELKGHTPGGIVLLDAGDRILFVGDSIIEHTWMQLPESLTMEEFIESLERIQSMRDKFDYLLSGHGRDLMGAEFCEEHLKAVREVAQGENEDDTSYTWFGGTCMAHPYGPSPRMIVYKKR